MTAAEVNDALRRHHPGGFAGTMPGAWTVIEEFRAIDVLAFSAWQSVKRYARVGYEVKVSRQDLRRELLKPTKRAANVAWCHEFYLAVPRGLLTDEELAYEELEWAAEDFVGERCAGFGGRPCESPWRRKIKTHLVRVPVPLAGVDEWRVQYEGWADIPCPTCGGKGYVVASRVEREAPTVWVPRDVGLVVVHESGVHTVKRSPRRNEVPALRDYELASLVRWVSMRPDPRHAGHPNARAAA